MLDWALNRFAARSPASILLVTELVLLMSCGGMSGSDSTAGDSGVGGSGNGAGGSIFGATGGSPCVDALPADPGRTAVAVFHVSASTNSPAYTFVLNSDGSAIGAADWIQDIGIPLAPCSLLPGSSLVLSCIQALEQVGDVSTIPVSPDCPKSVSFGTETTVTYDGRTSGDIQCIHDPNYSGVASACSTFI